MNGVVSFCVGTGRCGTTFLAELAGREPRVAASHERLRLSATFHMYCKWHGLDVDPQGFLSDREEAVAADLASHDVSFESSALLSHSIAELAARFDARFLLLVRSPHETVASFAARGWFTEPIAWSDAARPPTLREGQNPRHFFGRNLPRGPQAFARWEALTQVGRLGWFWNARNRAILEQLAALPDDRRAIVRLEELDHATYLRVARFLGWTATLSLPSFEALAAQRPNAGPNAPLAAVTWSALEAEELERETAALADALGYETSTARRIEGSPAIADEARPEVPRVASQLALTTLTGPPHRASPDS